MAIDIMTKALSQNYTDKVSEGLGAIKGANCTIKSTTKTDGNSLVVFEWTGTSGTKETASITVKDGVSIDSINIDESNYLVCVMSDGTEKKAKIELLDNVYTKEETDNLLKDKAESTHNHDDLYASKDKEHEHLNKETLDKFGVNNNGKLTFDGDVVTPEASDLSDYLKKTDAQNTYVVKETGKGLSENDLTAALKEAYDKAVEDSHTHSNKSVLDSITNEKIEAWDKAEENVQPDWDEIDDTADGFIKNKPTIPDITGLATETYVDNKVADYTKTADLADVATSGSYNDLADKPTIPSLDGYAKTSEIPSKVSELENDSNYLSSIPEEYVTDTELNAKGYLTEHQDISGKVDKVEGKSLIADTEIARLATVDNYDDTDIKAELANKADTTAIPSKVSELTNDSNYQTAEQVNSTVTTEIAKVVADAPEDLNTLKEMSDWIAGHEDDASAMNSAISDNKTAITALQTGKADKSEIPTTVAELTDSADYAKKTDIPTTLPANGGNSDTVNNHTVKSDVPENAVFTDTVYDDTDVQKIISDNGYGEVAGGKNLLNHNIIDSEIRNCSVLFKNDTFYVTNKGNYSYFVLSVPTIVGKSYTVTIKDWSDYSYRCIASVSDFSDNTLASMIINDATLSMTFTAVGTESLIRINPNNTQNEMSNTITFKCMLEEGSVATEYEPYFPSNKMLAEEVNAQNESLSDLENAINGLNDDNYWEQGTWNILGQKVDEPTIIRMKEKLILPIDYSVSLVNSNYVYEVDYYENGAYKNDTDWISGSIVIPNGQEFVLLIRKVDNSSLVPTERNAISVLPKNIGTINDKLKNDLAPKKIELQNVDEKVTIQDNGSFIINGFAFVNLLVTFNETLPQWSNFVRLPRPKGGNVSVHCENSVKLTIYSQDNLPGDCGTYDIVQSGTEVRLLVNYEVA